MDEMLKKQDVLDAIYEKMEKTDKPDVVLGLAAAMSTVKQMQGEPAEKVGQWIPVESALPELNRPLLVTAYHRVYYGHLISESGNYGYPVFRIHGLGDKNRDWVQETMSHEPYSLGRIDAWMYFNIPEPYKASPIGAESEE